MIIKSIKLTNFRCFDDCRIKFDDHLTVLVGINGAGKSSTLDALVFLLKSLMEQQINNNITHLPYNITLNDLSIGSNEGKISLYYNLFFDKRSFNISLNSFFNFNGEMPFKFSAHKPSLAFFESYTNYLANKENITNIFVSYHAGRNLPEKSTPFPQDFLINNMNHQQHVFLNAFSTSIDYVGSVMWFFFADANEARMRVALRNFDYENPELSAVRKAVAMALKVDNEEYEKLHVEGSQPELSIINKYNGKSYKVNQLSAGYKTMLGLVMDLSRRMVVANKRFQYEDAEDYLKTPAIVLIDEIEQHLHPSWQQTVLPKLMEIFPKTQFIVTTHSPHVLTSIKNHQIRILSGGKVFNVASNTYGTSSLIVQNEIMNVRSRPNNEVRQKIDDFLALINEGAKNNERVSILRKELEEMIPGDPFLVDADLMLSGFKISIDKEEI